MPARRKTSQLGKQLSTMMAKKKKTADKQAGEN
jgi:hypothetical protein